MRIVTPCPVYYLPKKEPFAWQLEISKTGYVTKEIDLGSIFGQGTNHVFALDDIELGPIGWLNNTNTANQAAQDTARKLADPGR